MNKWLRHLQYINERYGTNFKNLNDVKKFQKKYGLVADGKIGPKTEAQIASIYAKIKDAEEIGLGPIQLPELEVIGHTPTFTEKYILSPLQRAVTDFRETDPLFGNRRIELVDKNYGEDNPFKEGADAVGNVSVDTLMTALGIKGISGVAKLVASQGAKAIPQILATLYGAKKGKELWDNVALKMTGKTWEESLAESGFDPFGQATVQPGAWIGSYAGSVAGRLLTEAALNAPYYLANARPRLAMTPEGPVELQPGETVEISGRPIPYQQAPQGVSGWKGHYTTKGGANGSASGQGYRVQTSQGNMQTRIPGGVQTRVMGSVNSGNGNPMGRVTNEFLEYPGYSANDIIMPWFGSPYVEEPTGELIIGRPRERVQQITNEGSPFETWFGEQIKQGLYGTNQYYPGDDLGTQWSAPRWIRIVRGGHNAPITVTTTKIGDMDRGNRVVRDSTRVNARLGYPEGPAKQVKVLEGGVPREAVVTDEVIEIPSRKNGGLIKKSKFSKFLCR